MSDLIPGFSRAQAAYDAMLPPEVPDPCECGRCRECIAWTAANTPCERCGFAGICPDCDPEGQDQ